MSEELQRRPCVRRPGAEAAGTVAYGMPIPRTSEAVRRNVVNRVENLVGSRATEVNVAVKDAFFPEHEQLQRQSRGAGRLKSRLYRN